MRTYVFIAVGFGALVGASAGCANGTPQVRLEVMPDSACVEVTLALPADADTSSILSFYCTPEVARPEFANAHGVLGGRVVVEGCETSGSLPATTVAPQEFRIMGAGVREGAVVRYRVGLGTPTSVMAGNHGSRSSTFLSSSAIVAPLRSLILVPRKDVHQLSVSVRMPSSWRGIQIGDGWQALKLGARTFPAKRAHKWLSSTLVAGVLEPCEAAEGSLVCVSRGPARASGIPTRVWQVLRHRGYLKRTAPYVLVVLPEAASVLDAGLCAWPGGMLVRDLDLTAFEAVSFASEVLRERQTPAAVVSEPSKEAWVPVAISRYAAYRAAVEAGTMTVVEMKHQFRLEVATLPAEPGVEACLATWAGRPEREYQAASAILGGWLFLVLDDSLRSRKSHVEMLDVLASAGDRGTPKKQLGYIVKQIAGCSGVDAQGFFERYAYGQELSQLFDMEPARPAMARDVPAPAGRSLLLVYTGNMEGFLENCGCKANQAGGVARRAFVLDSLRSARQDLLLVDCGNTVASKSARPSDTSVDAVLDSAYLDVVGRMRYDATAINRNELERMAFSGPQFARGLRAVATNVGRDSVEMWPRSVQASAWGQSAVVMGLYCAPRGLKRTHSDRVIESQVLIADPVTAVETRLQALPTSSKVVIAGRIPADLADTLADRFGMRMPRLVAIVSTESNVFARARLPVLRALAEGQDHVRNGVAVVFAVQARYGVGVATIACDTTEAVVGIETKDIALGSKVREASGVRRRVTMWYKAASSRDTSGVAPILDWNQRREGGQYVGGQVCAGCHRREYDSWQKTGHAAAYKTLLEARREFLPRCVVCHVVGYGEASGYQIASLEGKLAGVQCEVCHGPGSLHAGQPARHAITRKVGAELCVRCHDREHSNAFVFAERLQRIVH